MCRRLAIITYIQIRIMTLRSQEMSLNARIGVIHKLRIIVIGYTVLLRHCYITYKLPAFLNYPIRVI